MGSFATENYKRKSTLACPSLARRASVNELNQRERSMLSPTSPKELTKLDHAFFARPAVELARDLIGKILVRRVRGRAFQARIVETEAYVGSHDLACHAAKGRTKRTEVMFGRAGHAYVYLIYGMYDMLNIVASDVDDPQAVLIRGAVPLDGWHADLSGPGKLTRAMCITRAQNGLDLTGEMLFLLKNPGHRPQFVITPRIGVDYAREWKDAMLRFVDATESRPGSRRPAS
jgi:DNA-3-methyladenine glycosylase